MRYLGPRPSPPACLPSGKAGQPYGLLTAEERDEIRAALHAMQSSRCAYCERMAPGTKDGHIEHFHQRADYPDKQRAWDNLFWSCNDVHTCGKRKDSCKPRPKPTDVVDPAKEDPLALLAFPAGKVQAREGLKQGDLHRASETIRAFGLDSAALSRLREELVAATLRQLRTVLDDPQYSPEDRDAFVSGERKIASEGHFASILASAIDRAVV